MHGEFDVEDELEPVPETAPDTIQAKRDTELTLGPLVLLGLFFGLVVLCGLCFGAGYTVGHRSGPETAAAAPQAIPAVQAATTIPKPSATPTVAHPPAPQPAADQTDTAPVTDATSTPMVHPALTTQIAPLALMVQVATVPYREDAEVLVTALRKRGYAATANAGTSDNQIHVRVGPFTSHADAEATRQKLLNDGYNAIVQ